VRKEIIELGERISEDTPISEIEDVIKNFEEFEYILDKIKQTLPPNE